MSAQQEITTTPAGRQFAFGPKHLQFLWDKHRYPLIGGAWRGGKTLPACIRALQLAARPGMERNMGLIGRWDYGQLRDTTMRTFFEEVCPPDHPGVAKWHQTNHELLLTNGSTIVFRHLSELGDIRGMNLGFFFVDQVEGITEEIWNELTGRLSRNMPYVCGFATANPTGNWVNTLWRENPSKDHSFINVSQEDNPSLSQEYRDSLKRTLPDDLYERYVKGSWDRLSGSPFPEFDPRTHVIESRDFSSQIVIEEGIDPGLRAPTAVSWIVHDPPNFYLVDELYERETTPIQMAAKIKERRNRLAFELFGGRRERFVVVRTTIDPSGGARSLADGRSVIDEYQRAGIYPIPGVRGQMGRIVAIRQRMRGTGGGSQLFIYRRCVHTINEIKGAEYKGINPDMPTDDESRDISGAHHAIDSMGYILQHYPVSPVPMPDIAATSLTETTGPLIEAALQSKEEETETGYLW